MGRCDEYRYRPHDCSGLCRRVLWVGVMLGVGVSGVVGGLLDFTLPDIVEYGSCSAPDNRNTLNLPGFSGVWYQVEEVPNPYVVVEACTRTAYLWDGMRYNVVTEGQDVQGQVVRQEAIISVVLPLQPALPRPDLHIRSPNVPPVPYHIVGTDYVSYACVYSCFEVLSVKVEVFSVLSRTPALPAEHLHSCRSVFTHMGLDITKLQSVRHDPDCWYNDVSTQLGTDIPGHAHTKARDSAATQTHHLADDSSNITDGIFNDLEYPYYDDAEEDTNVTGRELFGYESNSEENFGSVIKNSFYFAEDLNDGAEVSGVRTLSTDSDSDDRTNQGVMNVGVTEGAPHPGDSGSRDPSTVPEEVEELLAVLREDVRGDGEVLCRYHTLAPPGDPPSTPPGGDEDEDEDGCRCGAAGVCSGAGLLASLTLALVLWIR